MIDDGVQTASKRTGVRSDVKPQPTYYLDPIETILTPTLRAHVAQRVVPVLAWSGIAGVAVGVAATLFNRILEYAAGAALDIGQALTREPRWIALYVPCMLAAAIFLCWWTKVLPEARGSGIPRTEAMMCGKKQLVWWKMCLATFVGSGVSFVAGMSVGAEGPTVQFGGGLGAGVERLGGLPRGKRYVANSGLAAGVASAFIAPCTGVLFAIEEVQRKFDPLLIASAIVAVLYAYAVRLGLGAALGMHEILFAASAIETLPLRYIWAVVAVGVVAALCAKLFNTVILTADRIAYRSKLPRWTMIVAAFAVTAVVNIFVVDNVGSGAWIIDGILGMRYGWGKLLLLLAIKFALVALVFRGGVTGGMMVPMLALGAMLGALVGNVCVCIGMPQSYVPMLAMISMSAFFGACIRAPFTVIALFAETTGRTDALFALMLAVLISHALAELLRLRPLYDTLWIRDLAREGLPKQTE